MPFLAGTGILGLIVGFGAQSLINDVVSGFFILFENTYPRFRAESPDALDETKIDGITAFGATTMTVRTSTRVKPGRHDRAAAALRLAIKEAFGRRAAGMSRRGLVPGESRRGLAAGQRQPEAQR